MPQGAELTGAGHISSSSSRDPVVDAACAVQQAAAAQQAEGVEGQQDQPGVLVAVTSHAECAHLQAVA